jgi:predicted O-methyltransferase YrrM
MKEKLKRTLRKFKIVSILFDVIFSPITLLATLWVKLVRKSLDFIGRDGMPVTEKIFMGTGVYPVLDHYYQPLINPKKYLKDSLKNNRRLPVVNYNNDKEQLLLLSKFHYDEELRTFPMNKPVSLEYFYDNGSFRPGDSEYLYSIVRHFKPGKIVEIGSGNSSLMIRNAVKYNQKEDASYQCEHICIEPYEKNWLEQTGAKIIRQKVEDADPSIFTNLGQNDILFIDSSHMIRPQGDVLFEYLQLLPILKSGVLVHIHDIFTPNDYPDDTLNSHCFWNEQYLLEAFLCFNDKFKVLGAVNYLFKYHTKDFLDKFSIANEMRSSIDPCSFWMVVE